MGQHIGWLYHYNRENAACSSRAKRRVALAHG
jgi:hypothetical protein